MPAGEPDATLAKEGEEAIDEIRCVECNRLLDERVETIWNLVEGWEKHRAQGGTNHLACRQPRNVYRCNGCMTLILSGLSPGQTELGI